MDTRTPYTETEILLAVLDEDDETAVRMLAEMLPGELRTYADQVAWLQTLIERERRNQSRGVDVP